MNDSNLLINYSLPSDPMSTHSYILTFNDVLKTFSKTFVFRAELLAVMFFGVMLFLQWYTKGIERDYRKAKKANPGFDMPNREKYLIMISDIFFLPSAAFVLIFIGYESGWWI